MNKSRIKRLNETNNNYSRKDVKNYRRIKNVALKPIQTKLTGSDFRFSFFVCMISFVNSERKNLMWRSILRNVLRKINANANIKEYYD